MPRKYDKDPYAILGIPSTASASQVKQAYYRLARQNHPDINKDPGAVERMKEINWAYNILSDPEERSFYDRWGNSDIRVVYYGSTKSQRADATPPRSSPPPPPPPSSQPHNPYPKDRSVHDSQRTSTGSIPWLIIIVLITLIRAIPQVSQSSLRYPMENIATQTARADRVTSAMETLQASPDSTTINGTVTPFYQMPLTPSPITGSGDPLGQENLRAAFVPGSWEWEQVDRYFPHLTTPNGLSDEVTLVIYDSLRGYQLKTRSSGDYWLFVNRNDQTIMPAHFPAAP